LADETSVLGFHLQLSSGLRQSYIPIRYMPIKILHHRGGGEKMWPAPSGTYCWCAAGTVHGRASSLSYVR